MTRLRIQNFAHIADASIDFGDLTILVGAQGTGKSIALQWLKVALDGAQIENSLDDAGQYPGPEAEILTDVIFGDGMGPAWRRETAVSLDARRVQLTAIGRIGSGEERVFFIPAHRALLISDGWATPFQKLSPELPVVARLFSQNLFERFQTVRGNDTLFPLERALKRQFREPIDRAIYHGGSVRLAQDRLHTKRLKLAHGASQLSFMTWTAGQREFTPLLLGLYHALPARQLRRSGLEWIVIEEPEMGLHPQAITAFMLLVLDLLRRGYRVVLSTHSPLVLAAAWMLRRMRELNARWQLVCDAFDVPPEQRNKLRGAVQAALAKDVRIHLLFFANDRQVRSKDISSLDPGSEDEDVSGWGGLTEFSSRFGDAVRQAVNEAHP